jgi:Ca2+:H+ antiporter
VTVKDAGDRHAARWSVALPLLGAGVLATHQFMPFEGWFAALIFLSLVSCVLSAVHHAEVVAHRVGEPFGTLVLAVAVTVIEVALIVSVLLTGGLEKSSVARDTVFAAVMIVCNGVVGVCLIVGGIRHHQSTFRVEGTSPALAVLAALTTLTLVLPVFTLSTEGPTFSPPQLAFAGLASLTLYGVFVFVQTVRHRDFFLPVDNDSGAHAEPPTLRLTRISLFWLLVSLTAVVGLASALAPAIERGIAAAGAPKAVVGIAIALMVLAPETWAAVRAALANRLQTSLNLAIGSALASIGLTIPVVAALSLFLDIPLILGLDNKDIVLLALTMIVGTLTLSSGRTTVLQGTVHLVIFFAYLFMALVP